LRDEVASVTDHLKVKKSPGMDNMTAEEIHAAEESAVDALFELCKKIWEDKTFPHT